MTSLKISQSCGVADDLRKYIKKEATVPDVTYPFDPSGVAATNLVTDELRTLTEINSAPYRIFIPSHAPFYLNNLLLEHINVQGVVTELHEGIDYYPVLPYMAASRSIGQSIYGGLSIISTLPQGTVRLSKYQTLGGTWVADANYVYEQLLSSVYNNRTTWWDRLTNVQQIFPPMDHDHVADDIEGHQALLAKLDEIREAILTQPNTVPQLLAKFLAHIEEEGNVHSLHKNDIGLGFVENLPFATDQEVLELKEENRYISLRQVVLLLKFHNLITTP